MSVGEESDAPSTARIATEMTNNFIRITPPEMPVMDMITMRYGGYGGGKSTKPGNVLVNLGKLLGDIAEGANSAVTIGPPWLMLFAALMIVNKLRSRLEVRISEREAVVLWTMWKNRDHNNHIADDSLLELVNSELASNGRSKLSQQEMGDSLEALIKLRCIERGASISSNWRLRESISDSYR